MENRTGAGSCGRVISKLRGHENQRLRVTSLSSEEFYVLAGLCARLGLWPKYRPTTGKKFLTCRFTCFRLSHFLPLVYTSQLTARSKQCRRQGMTLGGVMDTTVSLLTTGKFQRGFEFCPCHSQIKVILLYKVERTRVLYDKLLKTSVPGPESSSYTI